MLRTPINELVVVKKVSLRVPFMQWSLEMSIKTARVCAQSPPRKAPLIQTPDRKSVV